MLKGKTIVLGVCGGIAAYKAVELLRLYKKAGADLHVIMTAAAQKFVTPLTFQTLSGNPVHTELFDLFQGHEIGHISLADRADLLVVAPATANLIGKVANGIADDLLSTTIMATRAPVIFAPAMNTNMLENPVYCSNQARLETFGYRFIEPSTGDLACGWQGKGKLPDPAQLFSNSLTSLYPADLSNETFLITAGPTREEIDPVRYLSNYSSGKMGYAIARAAAERGAKVVLISGPTALDPPRGVETLYVVSAQQMNGAVLERAHEATVVIKAAAVADYRPLIRADGKVKKEGQETWSLELEKNPDILATLGQMGLKALLVGFAAETDDLIGNARKKLEKKNVDLIVANDVSRVDAGFEADTNAVRLLFRDGSEEELPLLPKSAVANILLDRIKTLCDA
ncbi:MAG: bifunctional phosphopantothenoylcysteine decarboxylase/phosphopantothenate--cysteine ligase CoaBC [Desulfuromonadales bacterium]|nr:bifunctional phosphopantothenoylcysteine decarboxylase/phosphopantothenate--cysteine ligase CoaBC [Desulfuromonadales bacterium]